MAREAGDTAILLALLGVLLVTSCSARSVQWKVTKRVQGAGWTDDNQQHNGDLANSVQSMKQTLIRLEQRILNLEANETKLLDRLQAIEDALLRDNNKPMSNTQTTPDGEMSEGTTVSSQMEAGSSHGDGCRVPAEGGGDAAQNAVALLAEAETDIEQAANLILSNMNQTAPKATEAVAATTSEAVSLSGEPTPTVQSQKPKSPAHANHVHMNSVIGNHVVIHNEAPSDDRIAPTKAESSEKKSAEEGQGSDTNHFVSTRSNEVMDAKETGMGDKTKEEFSAEEEKQESGPRPDHRSFRVHQEFLPVNRRVRIHSGR